MLPDFSGLGFTLRVKLLEVGDLVELESHRSGISRLCLSICAPKSPKHSDTDLDTEATAERSAAGRHRKTPATPSVHINME